MYVSFGHYLRKKKREPVGHFIILGFKKKYGGDNIGVCCGLISRSKMNLN
jgi:hypothetical protein